jgi:hypothetical protein
MSRSYVADGATDALTCSECGATVAHLPAHEEWHARLSRAVQWAETSLRVQLLSERYEMHRRQGRSHADAEAGA